MKCKLLISTLTVTLLGLPLTAMSSESDCFPLCAKPANVESPLEPVAETTVDVKLDAVYIVAHRDVAIGMRTATACNSGFIKSAEALSDKVKPIREIVGYVRSPQGLVIKLVNDHIVKIPVWAGYAMDPIGSIKRKAFNEVKTRAKDAITDGNTCMAVRSEDSPGLAAATQANETVNAKHSI